jgi:anti-sigma factor (TIGR02949 family)
MTEPNSIDCEEALRRLLDFIHGELPARQGGEVSAHLERCRSCFSRAEFERRLQTHLRGLGEEPVSVELEQRIRALTGELF